MKLVFILLNLFLICVFAFSVPPKVIVIDPGHGGKDPGATYKGVYEKKITLDIGLLLQKKLRSQLSGIRIEITRNQDIFNHVTEKAKIANKLQGELFISIHANSVAPVKKKYYRYVNKPYYETIKGKKVKKHKKVKHHYTVSTYNNNVQGTEIYIWASDRTDNKSDAISSSYEGSHKIDTEGIPDLNSPEARLLSQMYAQRFFKSSHKLASLVDEEFKGIGRASRGVKQRNDKGIWVLQATAMPAILIEVGYVTHKKEAAYMSSKSGQEALASAIAAAVVKYVKQKGG